MSNRKVQVTNATVVSGDRMPSGSVIVLVDHRYALRHTVHHSPTGFNWGYGGSGPADLALSILELVLAQEDEQRTPIWRGTVCRSAWELHQEFKRDYVVSWGEQWSITIGEVRKWVTSKRAELVSQS